jgi:hypothetical protein
MSGNGWHRDEVAVICSPVSGKRVSSALKRRWRKDTHRRSRPAVHNELDVIHCMLDQYLRGLFVTPSEMALASRSQHMTKRTRTIGSLVPFGCFCSLGARQKQLMSLSQTRSETKTYYRGQPCYIPRTSRRSEDGMLSVLAV